MFKEDTDSTSRIILPTVKEVKKYSSKKVFAIQQKKGISVEVKNAKIQVADYKLGLPSLPKGRSRSDSGLISPEDASDGYNLPDKKTIQVIRGRNQLNKLIAVGLVGEENGGLRDIEAQLADIQLIDTMMVESSGIVLPPKKFVSKLDKEHEEKNKDHKEKKQQKSKEAALSYMSNPWNYFNSKMNKAGVSSPTGEIKNQIDKFRSKLPVISDESLALLKSPIKSIREGEELRLLNAGISEADYQAVRSPDISLIDVSMLDFIHEDSEGETLENFYDFLSASVDELFSLEANSGIEKLKYLANVCQYLSILSQAFLYKFGKSKLDNPLFLEKIISKLDFLTDGEFEHFSKYLQPLFDFISYFEMNNANASGYLLKILEVNKYQHPIIHELRYQLEPENRVDTSQPKIGIEVEGIPLITFGGIPEGFEMGIDGGLSMPEIRRKDNILYFDNTYKKQLYDLWHFARLTQFRGASLHIHIDDLGREKFDRFKNLLGANFQTVRRSSFGTVELRFNLSSYPTGSTKNIDLSVPFFHDQYDIVSFVEILMEFGENGLLNQDKLKKLSSYWKLSFDKNSPLSFEQVLKMSLESEWHRNRSFAFLERLSNPLSLSQFVKLSVESDLNYYIMRISLKKLGVLLSFEQLIEIIELSDGQGTVVKEALRHLKDKLSFEQVLELTKRLDSIIAINELFNHFERTLSIDEAIFLSNQENFKFYVMSAALSKLEGMLSLDTIINILLKHDINHGLTTVLFDKLENKLSFEEVMQIFNKLNLVRRLNIAPHILQKIDEKFTLEQTIQVLEKLEWRWDIFNISISKLNRKFSLEEVILLSKKSEWNLSIVINAIRNLEGQLSLEDVMSFVMKLNIKYNVAEAAFDKFEGKFSFQEIIALQHKLYWKWNQSIPILSKLEGNLSFDQVVEIFSEGYPDESLINLVFDKFNRNISSKEAIRILKIHDWRSDMVIKILEKLEEKSLSIGKCVFILKQFNWHSQVMLGCLFRLQIINDKDMPNFINMLRSVPKNKHLLMRSFLLMLELETPIRIDEYLPTT